MSIYSYGVDWHVVWCVECAIVLVGVAWYGKVSCGAVRCDAMRCAALLCEMW